VEVAPALVPVDELTRSSSPSNMLLEAVSEALGISLSEVLALYFGKYDVLMANDNDIVANVEECPRTTLGDLQGDQSKELTS
jgi:hypothetical protein